MSALFCVLSLCLVTLAGTVRANPLCLALHDAEAVAAVSGAPAVPPGLSQRLRSAPRDELLGREVDALSHALDVYASVGGEAALNSMRVSLRSLRRTWPECFFAAEELTNTGATERATSADRGIPDPFGRGVEASRDYLSRVAIKSPQWVTIELGLIMLCSALLVVVLRRPRKRRRNERLLCNVPARIKAANVWEGSMINVSIGGAQLQVTGHKIKVGEHVDIACKVLKTSAKVRWVNLHFVGVQFAKRITEEDLRALVTPRAREHSRRLSPAATAPAGVRAHSPRSRGQR